MTEVKEIFYNIFWKTQACRNLFLLSKEELLDTKTIELEGIRTSVSFPRIIISNIDKNDESHQVIKFRTETERIKTENRIASKVAYYTPIIEAFIESKFGKGLQQLAKDLNQSPHSFLKLAAKLLLSNDKNREEIIIKQLQKYSVIGKHINTIAELETYFSKEGLEKGLKGVMTEQNVRNLFEVIKSIKDVYVTHNYSDLYSSNQVLVNALLDQDNFESRIKLFKILYESQVLLDSNEDAFIQCMHCNPGTFKGIMQVRMNPSFLSNLMCPACSNPLTYHVPYELAPDIYSIVKTQDGLLLDALCNLLDRKKMSFNCNVKRLNDIEFDCIHQTRGKIIYIECKMYKMHPTAEKLESKLKEHFTKLINDITRAEQKIESAYPILLVNIPDDSLLDNVLIELKQNQPNELVKKGRILNLNQLEKIINEL